MELREIRTFMQIARLKSFSKAAKNLGYTQAAVTIQIRQLEQELGTRLFDRIGKQTLLTHDGTVFYGYASKVLKELAYAKEVLSGEKEPTGTLRIGAIESICASFFPTLLSDFHEKYPRVSVSVFLESPATLLDRLAENHIDLVYLLDQEIYDPRWVKVMEKPEEIVFIAPADHPVAQKPLLSLDEVLAQPFILTEKSASYRYALDQYLASVGRTIHPFLEIGNTDFIISHVESGLGLSFLPEYTARAGIEAGTIAALPVRGFHMHSCRQILYHKDKWVTREMSAFLELAQET